jgi:O-antigen/teichoic acid export membrane protein
LLTGGRTLNAVIGVVGVGITARYLGVGLYGALVTALAFISIVNVLTDVGIWTIGARELAKRPNETQRLVSALLTAGLAIAAVGAAVALALAFILYPGQDNELQRRGILLLMLTIPLSAPAGAVSAYFIAQQRAYVGMLGSVAQSAIMLVLLILTAGLDWGYTGVVLAYVFGAAGQGVLLLALSIGKVRLRPSFELGLSARLLRAALPVGGALVVGAIYWRLDTILLSLFVPASEVAHYGLAYKILDFLIVLPAYITITLLPEFARLASRRPEFDSVMQRAFSVMQVGAVAVLVFFVVFADQVVVVAGGDKFAGAAPLLRILMVGVAISYVGAIFGQGLIALDRQRDLFLFAALLVLPLNLGANLALIPVLGNYGAALAYVITEVVAVAAAMYIFGRRATLPRFHRPLRVAAAGCVMAAVALLLLVPGVQDASPVVVLCLGALLSGPLYAAALYSFGAMPEEIHTNLLAPLWMRVRPSGRTPRP